MATCAAVGVPVSAPVEVLNAAQLGRFVIDQVSARPSGSEPVGRNEYALPAVTDVGGVPLRTGGRLVVPPLRTRHDVMENAGRRRGARRASHRDTNVRPGARRRSVSCLRSFRSTPKTSAHDGLLTME